MSSSEAFPEPAEFVRQQAFLKRLARGILGDDALAEDVVQDAWLAWIRNKDRVHASNSWLAQAVRNLSSNACREQARRNARERFVARDERLDPTEDDLELAQFVLAALRALDEPLKTTLVLRYLHDLTPKEIAERQRLPIDTVKARLKRGLCALRAALDRRHDGDARAWAPLLARFAGRQHPGATDASTLAGAPSSSVVPIALACAGLVAALLFALTLRKGGLEPARSTPALASAPANVDLEPPPQSSQREPIASKPKLAAKPDKAPRVTDRGAAPFDWPQYAGGPAHDNLRKRASLIDVPKIAWHVSGALGQPTMLGATVYSGGYGLFRIRARDGVIEAHSEPSLARGPLEPTDVDERLAKLGYSPGGRSAQGGRNASIGDAPILTGHAVIVRAVDEQAIIAYDPWLQRELWRYTRSGALRAGDGMSGVYVGALVIYGFGDELVALQHETGAVIWSHELPGDNVFVVPAADGGRVFFATGNGAVYALDVASGAKLWEAHEPAIFGFTNPVVVQGRVVITDRGHPPGRKDNGRRAQVHAFSTETGEKLWSHEFGASGFSTPGVAGKYFVAGFGKSVARFYLASGKRFEPTIATGANAFGSPTVVGNELVFGNLDGNLYVHDLKTGALRWAFHVPDAQVHDFVHAGERIYVATTRGLYALENDPKAKFTPGFVLEAPGDSSGISDVSEGLEDQR